MIKWRKLGKVFDTSEHKLPIGCFGFAQSPQTLVFDDFVRIYFSTRKDDSNGKFLSFISYIEMDKNLEKIINTSSETIIELGKLGTFDEHGIFPINLLKLDDKVFAYTCGWSRRVSVSVETSIGLAISDDNGRTFKKFGDGPIMSSSLNEPFLVGDAFVQIYNNTFHMWYIYGTAWLDNHDEGLPARIYKIGHATSADGKSWVRDNSQIIPDKLNIEECQALPTVVEFNNKFHMFFCYRYSTGFRKNRKRGYRIGYAYSDDLINWTRNDDQVGIETGAEGSWDSDMMCYPHVFKMNGNIYLLYNGNEFGRYGFGAAVMEF